MADNWITSTPEAQGMDSRRLAVLLDTVRQQGGDVHSVLVLRNGVCVLEAYTHPYAASTLHDLRSAAKSITALVVGMAFDHGYLRDINQPVLDFFPGHAVANLNERKQAITIRHLLTMTSALDMTDADTGDMLGSADWVQWALDRPMAAIPGTRFQYATGNVHLLSAVVTRAAGRTMLDFARERLFAPLGIKDVYWNHDPQGNTAGMFLFLKPRDMAKIGQMMLDGGVWHGQQILSQEWVRAVTSPQIPAEGSRAAYGYLWWVFPDHFMAAGYAGQYIYVVPKQRLEVVFTGALKGEAAYLHHAWLDTVVRPSVLSDTPLPENPNALAVLQAHVQAMANPMPSPVPPLPETTARVSGKTYEVSPNVFQWQRLRFDFTPGADTALVTVNGGKPLTVGLDNVFRVTMDGYFIHWLPRTFPVALKGAWENAGTLVIHFKELGVPEPHRITFTFAADRLDITAIETLNDDVVRISGKITVNRVKICE